jgi:hypothetical protein
MIIKSINSLTSFAGTQAWLLCRFVPILAHALSSFLRTLDASCAHSFFERTRLLIS